MRAVVSFFLRFKFLWLALAFFAAVLPIMPFHDDWWYLTSPKIDFALKDLLPAKSFWRPFDAIFGFALGFAPFLFPLANKIAIVLAHVLNIWMVDRVLMRLRSDDTMPVGQRIFAVGVMAFSSAVVSALVNTDTVNQVWCVFWGLCGTYLLLSPQRKCYPGLAAAMFFLSIMTKESGVAWLAVAPLLDYVRTRDFRMLCRRALVGGALLAVYFALRFLLQGHLVLSEEEYYTISFYPIRVIYNFAVGVVMGCSAIDGLAFFTGKYFLFALSLLLSLGGWTLLLSAAFRFDASDNFRRAGVGALIVLAFVAPHCFFKYFHPAELHFYSVVVGVALAFGCMRFSAGSVRLFYSGVICMFLLFALGWADKIYEIYGRSQRLRAVMAQISNSGMPLDSPVAFVVWDEPRIRCYSVFSQPVIHGLGMNAALDSMNGWKKAKAVAVVPGEVPSLPAGTRVIWLEDK